MKNKVTVKEFFTVQWKVFCELVTEYGYKAIALIILTVFCAVIETVNLKVLEKTVDSASLYFANSTGENLQNLIQIFVIFACNIVLLMIMLAIQNRGTIKFRSVAQSRVEVKTTKKLSEISYEYFEFALFHEKIEFAKRASGQYANGIFAVTEIANIAISLIAYVFLLSRIHFVYICAVIVSVVICSVIAARVTQFTGAHMFRRNPADKIIFKGYLEVE